MYESYVALIKRVKGCHFFVFWNISLKLTVSFFQMFDRIQQLMNFGLEFSSWEGFIYRFSLFNKGLFLLVKCTKTSFLFYGQITPNVWYITFYAPFHHLMDIWVVSNLGPLWLMLVWTIIYKFSVSIFLFLLIVYLGIKLLGHLVVYT